ncbi:DUF1361 domain-containing protein [Pseudostreptobacillus sp.]
MNKILKKYSFIILIYIIILLAIYPKYYFLIWNIFLAYIPFLLSFIKIKNKFFKCINNLIALVFFPNVIYLFTDLIHISVMKYYVKDTHGIRYIMNFTNWIRLSLIFVAVLIAIKLSYISLNNFIVNYRFKHIIYVFISILTGVAVYIGRFIRLNSWDLILNPFNTLIIIFKNINSDTIQYILLFAIIQYIVLIIMKDEYKK